LIDLSDIAVTTSCSTVLSTTCSIVLCEISVSSDVSVPASCLTELSDTNVSCSTELSAIILSATCVTKVSSSLTEILEMSVSEATFSTD